MPKGYLVFASLGGRVRVSRGITFLMLFNASE
jgi:hypothetical protein